MIIIDYSSMCIATLMAGFRSELETNDYAELENIAKHAILSSIKFYKKKFSDKFGKEIVIAVDNKQYWRKQVFPQYKHGRKKSRDDSGINWDLIFKSMDSLKQDLISNFPYKVIDVAGAEADDVMAIVSTKCASIKKQSTGIDFGDDEAEPVLIITKDKDMSQLLKHKHIKIWNPFLKQQVKLDVSANEFLTRLILTGDTGDGIPNVFSPINSIADGIRQKPATEKKIQAYLQDGHFTDSDVMKRIQENTMLISFDCIPESVSDAIIAEYSKTSTNTKSDVLKYLLSKKMKLLVQDVEDF